MCTVILVNTRLLDITQIPPDTIQNEKKSALSLFNLSLGLLKREKSKYLGQYSKYVINLLLVRSKTINKNLLNIRPCTGGANTTPHNHENHSDYNCIQLISVIKDVITLLDSWVKDTYFDKLSFLFCLMYLLLYYVLFIFTIIIKN